MSTHELIKTVTVGSGGASSISFTSIPQNFTDLIVMTSTRNTTSADQIIGSVNGNLGTSYRAFFGDGTAANGTFVGGWMAIQSTSANSATVFGNGYFYYPNYALTQAKFGSFHACSETNGANPYITIVAGYWSSTTAITTLSFAPQSSNFVEYSSMSLYGIKNS